jgi:F-type H+-transporting ATPase subunit delta
MATSIVKRYAKAIVELAIENNNSSTWVNNFDDAHTFLSNRDLFAFLTSPQVPQMEKFKSIDTLKNFIKVLISRNQINLFQNIKEDFIRQFQSSTGKISAIISSAVKISDTQRKLIIENICKIFDVNEVDVQEKIDQKILGGLIINVGDTVIDISTSNKLENLKKHLLKTSTL